MIGYLLFSHGSLLCGAGQSLDQHAMRIGERLTPCPVEAGYLNYSEPDVEVAVKRLVDRGANRIIVIPYFLVPGYFVTTSLPKRLSQIAPDYPNVKFEIAEAIGVDSRVSDAVLSLIGSAREPLVESSDVLRSAGAACRLIDTCPLYATANCPRFVGSKPMSPENLPARESFQLTSQADKSLLVMIHGSPNEKANQPMLDVLSDIRRRTAFATIQPGFMECNSPTIPEAVDMCAESGPTTIIAIPYFLHLGTHVADDLPTLLGLAQMKHPQINILMTDYLGQSEKLTEVLYDRGLALANST